MPNKSKQPAVGGSRRGRGVLRPVLGSEELKKAVETVLRAGWGAPDEKVIDAIMRAGVLTAGQIRTYFGGERGRLERLQRQYLLERLRVDPELVLPELRDRGVVSNGEDAQLYSLGQVGREVMKMRYGRESKPYPAMRPDMLVREVLLVDAAMRLWTTAQKAGQEVRWKGLWTRIISPGGPEPHVLALGEEEYWIDYLPDARLGMDLMARYRAWRRTKDAVSPEVEYGSLKQVLLVSSEKEVLQKAWKYMGETLLGGTPIILALWDAFTLNPLECWWRDDTMQTPARFGVVMA